MPVALDHLIVIGGSAGGVERAGQAFHDAEQVRAVAKRRGESSDT